MRPAAVLGLFVTLLALAACGGGGSGGETAEPAAQATTSAPETTTEAEPLDADYQACTANIGPFVDSLNEMNSRLNVGLNYDEYSDFLGDIQVEYDKVDVDGASTIPGCIEVAVDAEKAFNAYTKASNIWQKCFEDIYCENADVRPRLQRNWSRASSRLEEVQAALDVMEAT